MTFFADLGFSEVESKELRLRSDLLRRLQEKIEAMKESQQLIADRLGVTQPRVSDVRRGKLHLFSLEALIQMLEKLGSEVSVTIHEQSVESKTLCTDFALFSATAAADVVWVTSESTFVIEPKVTEGLAAPGWIFLETGLVCPVSTIVIGGDNINITKSVEATAANTQLSLAA